MARPGRHLVPLVVALLVVLAGCAGDADGPVGTATSGTVDTASAPPSPGPSPSAPPTPSTSPAPSPTATPVVDPSTVVDHGDLISETARELVATAATTDGEVTREGAPDGIGLFERYPHVNYDGACYEVSVYRRVRYAVGYDRFRLEAVDAGAVENESAVVAYGDLPPADRAAVDEALSEGQALVHVSESVHVERNGSSRHVETASVVTEYDYVRRNGTHYAVTDVTGRHEDRSEVLSTTLVVEQLKDEPCRTD